MTTTIRLKKDTVNKINALDGKSQDDKWNKLLQNVVKCSNPTDSDKVSEHQFNALLKAFNGMDEWHIRIESAIRAQEVEIKSIRELISSHIN